jgi:hypothetical protein
VSVMSCLWPVPSALMTRIAADWRAFTTYARAQASPRCRPQLTRSRCTSH